MTRALQAVGQARAALAAAAAFGEAAGNSSETPTLFNVVQYHWPRAHIHSARHLEAGWFRSIAMSGLWQPLSRTIRSCLAGAVTPRLEPGREHVHRPCTVITGILSCVSPTVSTPSWGAGEHPISLARGARLHWREGTREIDRCAAVDLHLH